MPLDWNSPDVLFLKKQMQSGNTVLFAGAGCSADCKNPDGQSLPVGAALSVALAHHGGFEHNGESLPEVFAAVRLQVGERSLNNFLECTYSVDTAPAWCATIPSCIWHRIYTTNIDNLFPHIYPVDKGQTLKPIVCPEPFVDRDPLFDSVQCIYLHGSIIEPAKGFTFTHEQFATHTSKPDAWYQTFIDDYFYRSVIFVGYRLEEAPFYHYMNLRDSRTRNVREYRPKSYLVSPHIGKIREKSLAERNIVAIEMSASEFFDELAKNIPESERTVDAVRSHVFPHHHITDTRREIDLRLSRNFDHVLPDLTGLGQTPPASSFFLGAEPIWYDIKNRHDAHRDINDLIQNAILNQEAKCVLLLGHAGSGKTTALMRVAASIAAEGHVVYFPNTYGRLDLEPLILSARELQKRDRRVIAFIDNVASFRAAIERHETEIQGVENLSLVLADRTNRYRRNRLRISQDMIYELHMQSLTETDVTNILDRLEHFGELGVLKGYSADKRVKAFMEVAEKQILVAMREATSGRGFDVILQDEFAELPIEGQLAYTICSIAVDRGAPGVYRRHLLPALGRTTLKKSALLAEALSGVLVPAGNSDTMVKPRHRLIAKWIATEVASKDLRLQAMRNFLTQISSEIEPNEIRRRSPAYLAYRGMINCNALEEEFDFDHSIILGLYDDLRPYYDHDFLFWLQYAMAHMEAGNLDAAENYLNQSLGIAPHSFQTRNQLGMLYLKQAIATEHPGAFLDKANDGIAILRQEIKVRGEVLPKIWARG